MNRDEITDQVKQVFVKEFGEDALARLERDPKPFKRANEASHFVQDLDSLDHVEFIMAVEDHFKISIDDLSAAGIHTLDDAVNAVETRLKQPVLATGE